MNASSREDSTLREDCTVRPFDSGDRIDPEIRALAIAAVGASILSWWPAFTLGAYHTVFFEQVLALWAASTSAFLVLTILKRRRSMSWPRRLALLLPTVWLVVAFALPTGTEAGHNAALFWSALVLTLGGGPYFAWTMLRITVTGFDTLTRHQRLVVVGVVAAVILIGFVLGHLNAHFLTCGDFTISGNHPPPDCTPGPPTRS